MQRTGQEALTREITKNVISEARFGRFLQHASGPDQTGER